MAIFKELDVQMSDESFVRFSFLQTVVDVLHDTAVASSGVAGGVTAVHAYSFAIVYTSKAFFVRQPCT